MSTILGIVASIGILFGAIASEGGGLGSYIHIPAMIIVGGGTLAAVFTSFPLPNVIRVAKVLVQIFKKDIEEPSWAISFMVRLSMKARQQSLLSLETDMRTVHNRFIRQGLEMIIDGHPGELIREVLETEVALVRSRHIGGANIFISAAKYAPAFGLIGTLVGLVAMFKSMGGSGHGGESGMGGLGKGMSVALLTTFYGAMLSNLFLSPIAEKLRNRSDDEILSINIIIEGLLMIQSGLNPRLLEKKLNSFLAPHQRVAHYDTMSKQQPREGGGAAAPPAGGGRRPAPPPARGKADDFDDDF